MSDPYACPSCKHPEEGREVRSTTGLLEEGTGPFGEDVYGGTIECLNCGYSEKWRSDEINPYA
jgi:C4-type Zn-finger protein